MKSTVKRTYDRNVLPDATIEIQYKGHRLNAHQIGASGLAQFAVLVGVFIAMMNIFNKVQRDFDFGIFFWICDAVVTYFILKTFFYSRRYRLLLSNEGIVFPRSSYGSFTGQLPYSEIDELGMTNWSSSGKNGFYQSTNVYASSGGTEVKITRFIPQTLAEALIREINEKMNSVQCLEGAH